MSLVGRIFTNRYEIEREIAQGGMAEVYLARDRLLDRPVALKALFPEYAREPSFVERFRREAQAAANLNHPNIVAIYDWGQESGTYFIVMEHVEGRSLRDLVRSEGPLDPYQTAEITAEIANALAFAHRSGVVHRDVKPGNVLITRSGNVKVTDFGIARAGTSDGLTQTGSVMGTATYFSPEQAQGLPVDGRSDVYSLGVVLYEMVTGVAPFTGDSPVAVAYKHVREAAVPPTRRNPDVPLDLEQIILTALAKDPDHRYQTADDMRADLLRFRRGRPLAAAPVTALVAEVPTGATAAAGAAAGAYAAAATMQAPRVPGPPAGGSGYAAGGSPPGRRRAFATAFTLLVLVVIVAGIVVVSQLAGTEGPQVDVPDVVTQNVEDARTTIERAGLEVEVDMLENEDFAADVVFAQDPPGGESIDRGDTVTLSVSTGAGSREIPDVTGEVGADAETVLRGEGFEIAVAAEQSDDVEFGHVIRTEPEAGELLAVGETVTIVLSAGPNPIPVPDVDGELEADASRILGEEGFGVRVETEASEEVDAGRVIRTEPPSGDDATPGSAVTIVVSTGTDRVAVPSVIGRTQVQAESELTALGLGFRIVAQSGPDANVGKVVDQDPNSDTLVDPATEVVLFVGVSSSSPTTSATTTSTAP